MSIIKVMNPKLANMIAAGEVVDRPASIIKELVENSIDAKSTIITVEVIDYGMTKIIVSDNGVGMDILDAHLAFDRHATSKIKDESDLSQISTLGFRGEALAAISSVSKVTLKTRQINSDAIYVTYHGGVFVEDGKTSLNIGTEVIVSDLFYNTPARFKYIKSEVSEKAEIIHVFDKLALANPHIRMKLIMDQKEIKQTFGNNDFYSLIDQIYGQKMTKGMITFSKEVQKTKIHGYLLSKDINRSRKKDISIFVNKRYIKNYMLVNAVVEGYHSFLMKNKYPIALIHLEIDPKLLDVNVHPQKFEVKFVNELFLTYHIERYIKEALTGHVQPIKELISNENNPLSNHYEPIQMVFNEEVTPYQYDTKLNHQIKETISKIPDFDFIGSLSGTYLLFQNNDGLFLVDQHAAQERIKYEHYYNKLSNPSHEQKQLLLPYESNLTKDDLIFISNYIDYMSSFGFKFNNQMFLTSIPIWLNDDDIDKSLESIVTMLQTKNEINIIILRDDLAKDMSCKGSIRANKALNQDEVNQLMNDLRKAKNPYTCPHGRPTIVKLSNYEIEKLFKRIV